MSDDTVRPRRALDPDDTAESLAPSPGRDDSPFARPASSASSPARRFLEEPDDAVDDPAPSGSDVPARGLDFSRHDVDPEPEPSSEAAPSPADPPAASPDTLIPAPVLPSRGEGFYDGPGPVPRRSALSSSTPPEPPPAEDPTWEVVDDVPPADETPRPSWFAANSKALLVAGVGIAVLAAGAGAIGYLTGQPASAPSRTPSPSPSVSDSPTAPRVEEGDLMTEADAKAINAGATWAITNTTTAAAEHPARPACFSTEPSSAERLDSLQRTLGTTEESQLAVLQQIDAYPSVEAAQAALEERAGRMAACDEVPMRIVQAESVTGVGEESYQITVVHEGEQFQYHTLLLTRVGNILSITDAFSNGEAVGTDLVVAAVERSMGTLCERVGSCSGDAVAIAAKPVPAVAPAGWLIPSDLPRLVPGSGRWSAQTPAALTSRGIGCEDMTLATAGNATERLQNTYLMTQDDASPDQFGLDQMIYTFPDNASASGFAGELSENLETCAERVLGTEVTTVDASEGTVAYDVTRETDGGEIAYQVAVVTEANQVSYLLATVTEDYRFETRWLDWIAQRAGVRLTQA